MTTEQRPASPISPADEIPDRPRKTFFGHPWTLRYVASLQFWDQFSYYGMQAILVIYLYYSVTEGGLGFDQLTAIGIVGAYAGASYMSGALSGWLADRVLGAERALFYAACAVTAGHLALGVLPGVVGLFTGLFLVALGSGGIKTNTSTVIGQLYAEGDSRRDAGFSIFYTAAQVGAIIGPVLVGVAHVSWGFHFGFGLAGIGMAIGLLYYARGRRYLPVSGKAAVNPLASGKRARYAIAGVALVTAIAALVVAGVINAGNISTYVTLAALIVFVAILAMIFTRKSLTTVERDRMIALMPWLTLMIVYCIVFVLGLTMLSIFADAAVNRMIGAFEMPVAWTSMMVPLFFVVISVPVAALWTKAGDRQPPTPLKLCIGLALAALSMIAFIPMTGHQLGQAPLWGLLLVALLIGASEVFVIPLMMSLSSALGPQSSRAQTISLVGLCGAIGGPLSAVVAGSFAGPQTAGGFFGAIGIVVALMAGLFALTVPWALRRMHGVR